MCKFITDPVEVTDSIADSKLSALLPDMGKSKVWDSERWCFYFFTTSHLIFFFSFYVCDKEGCPGIFLLDRNITKFFPQLQKARLLKPAGSCLLTGTGWPIKSHSSARYEGVLIRKPQFLLLIFPAALLHAEVTELVVTQSDLDRVLPIQGHFYSEMRGGALPSTRIL